jgi:hypothetical protein
MMESNPQAVHKNFMVEVQIRIFLKDKVEVQGGILLRDK